MEDAKVKALSQEDLRQNAGGTEALWLLYPFFLRALLASWPVSQDSASLHLKVVSVLLLFGPAEPCQSIVTKEQQGIRYGQCVREGKSLEELSNAHFFHPA